MNSPHNDETELRDDEIPVTFEEKEKTPISVGITTAVLPALVFILCGYIFSALCNAFEINISSEISKAVIRAIFLAVLVIMYKRKSVSLDKITSKITARIAVVSVLLGVFLQICFAFLVSLTDRSTVSVGGSFALSAFLVSVILTPICEELIFREIMFGGIRQYAKFLPSALISSLFFGMIHSSFEGISVAIIMGIVLSFIYENSESLKSAVIVHSMFNFTAYFLGYVMPFSFAVRLAIALFSAVLSVIMLIILKRKK